MVSVLADTQVFLIVSDMKKWHRAIPRYCPIHLMGINPMCTLGTVLVSTPNGIIVTRLQKETSFLKRSSDGMM